MHNTEVKPKILILADKPGWAYDLSAQSLKKHLGDEFDITVAYVCDQPDLSTFPYDIVHVCWWGETYHIPFTRPHQVVKEISSHRWQEDGPYGPKSPKEFCKEYLADAGVVVATSKKLQQLINPVRPCFLTPNGFDERICESGEHSGPLTIGWAGNAADQCKGLQDIILPAAQGLFELQIAPGNLSFEEMCCFYAKLDILCVASTYEGEPLTLLESMAAGCFPICTDVGIAPELIRNGENGLIVPRTAEAFRNAFHWCAEHKDKVRAAGRKNSMDTQKGRSWAQMKGAWRRAWKTALEASREHEKTLGAEANSTCSLAGQHDNISKKTVIEQLKTSYSRHYGKMNTTQEAAYNSAFFYYSAELAFLPSCLKKHNALDIGVGHGYLLRYLKEQGFNDLMGIDIDTELANHSANYLKTYNIPVFNYDAFDFLPSRVEHFGLITAFDVIEHFPLEEGLKFLTNIYNSLVPGGIVVLRTPNMANLFGGYSRYMDLTHQMGFTDHSLVEFIYQAGFSSSSLYLPKWPAGHPLTKNFDESKKIHEYLFSLADRTATQCFDKNIVAYGIK
ncbi:MAG TPA: glycosyltransferase [Desulfovibrio sp.]|uniref:glycosyltransferase n=1 Tax=Desulfovibrio sp. TaxID=885 RepID=UPI002D345447|nr:glycosyltransferase [Desulfovibrio sp.]HZF60274.1 glycosyltransferase [Desulfovibrio sp.]